jgi:hypothetical protein
VTHALVAAHDPGGANAVAAVTALLRSQGIDVLALTKGPARRQFELQHVPSVEASDGALAAMVQSPVSIVITGTSEQHSFEREAVLAARRSGIPSVAIVDYWMKHRQRFRAADGTWVLPDHVVAIDEMCRAQMLAEGVPEARIHVLGQPYFSVLLRRSMQIDARNSPARRVLFVSEPGAVAAEALDATLEGLASLPRPLELTIRFHPRESERGDRLHRISRAGLGFTVDDAPDPLTTVCNSDAVIGVTSMLLIESSLVGVPTAGFGGDVRALMEYGLCTPMSSAQDVAAFVTAPRCSAADGEFLAAQREAADRVAAFCVGVAVRHG